jgi:large subunit ribosomal protein L23
MNEHDIIKTASLTEKSTLMSEKQNKYVFRVSPKANKIQIKNAIERLFQKTVVNVNTCNYAGKEKRLARTSWTSPAVEESNRDIEGGREDRPSLIARSYGTQRISPANADAAFQVAACIR